MFNAVPKGSKGGRPPSDNLQFFGTVALNGKSKVIKVTHYDRLGTALWSRELKPAIG
jgi:alkaline phosphatase D